MYSVEFSKAAERQFRKLDPLLQKRLAKSVDGLAKDPRPNGVKKLSGESGIYRVRVGDYRIVYAIRDSALLVLIVRVGHRREIY